MPPQAATLIRVYDQWDGWHCAEVRIDDFMGVHWFQPPGAPHRLVHGFILCTSVVTGHIPHDCEGGSVPHRLLVCVVKKQTAPTAFEDLVRRAEQVTCRVDDSPTMAVG